MIFKKLLQNASGKASQTSFTCESERETVSWTIANTLGRLHRGYWMVPLGVSTKQNVGGVVGLNV